MNLLHKLKNFWKAEGAEEMFTPTEEQYAFTLEYKNLEIGTLRVQDGEWIFKYSEEFKQQQQLKPLVDFPSIHKEYRSKELWPFFASRIPSLNIPTVQETVRKRNIDAHNEVQMLSEFGRRTITNPFLLMPQEA